MLKWHKNENAGQWLNAKEKYIRKWDNSSMMHRTCHLYDGASGKCPATQES